jgi:hypothetical protein
MGPKTTHGNDEASSICPEGYDKVHHCKYCDRYFKRKHDRYIHQHKHTCQNTILMPKWKKAGAMNRTYICLDCLESFPKKGAKEAILKYMSLAVGTLDRSYFNIGSEQQYRSQRLQLISDTGRGKKQGSYTRDLYAKDFHCAYANWQCSTRGACYIL